MNDSANERTTERRLARIAKLGGCILVSSSLVAVPISASAQSESATAESLESRIEKARKSLSSYITETSEPAEAQHPAPSQRQDWPNGPWEDFQNFPNFRNFYNY